MQDQFADSEETEEQINLLLQIARSEQSDGQLATALETLNHALEINRKINNKKLEGTTLNNISQIYDARGDYATALTYLNQSLAIRQEIGDITGLCASLFNIGHMLMQNEQAQKAMQAWVKVYQIAKKINLAQILDAIENLAKNLGLDKGLDSWEKLASKKL